MYVPCTRRFYRTAIIRRKVRVEAYLYFEAVVRLTQCKPECLERCEALPGPRYSVLPHDPHHCSDTSYPAHVHSNQAYLLGLKTAKKLLKILSHKESTVHVTYKFVLVFEQHRLYRNTGNKRPCDDRYTRIVANNHRLQYKIKCCY